MILLLDKHKWGHRKLIALLLIVVLAFFFGCAAREKLDTYPQRHIDRPFTLPKGINSWETIIYYEQYEDQENHDENNFFPYPLIWRQPITDNLNLVWSPLPLSLEYQLINTEKHTAGVSGAFGLGYASTKVTSTSSDSSTEESSTEDWYLDVVASGYYKYKFSDSVAIESGLVLKDGFGYDEKELWEVDFYSGPLFQVRDNLAIAPRIHLAVDRVGDQYDFFDSEREFKQEDTRWTYPIGLWIGWSLHKQLDLNIEYTYKALGYSNDFEGHFFTASIVHLW